MGKMERQRDSKPRKCWHDHLRIYFNLKFNKGPFTKVYLVYFNANVKKSLLLKELRKKGFVGLMMRGRNQI